MGFGVVDFGGFAHCLACCCVVFGVCWVFVGDLCLHFGCGRGYLCVFLRVTRLWMICICCELICVCMFYVCCLVELV